MVGDWTRGRTYQPRGRKNAPGHLADEESGLETAGSSFALWLSFPPSLDLAITAEGYIVFQLLQSYKASLLGYLSTDFIMIV